MHRNIIRAAVITAISVISLATCPDRSSAQSQPNSTDLIGAGAAILNSLINPPTRAAEIAADAEVKKAKIAADAEITKEKMRIEAAKTTDRALSLLDRWGVTRVNCAPGVVFINGINADTVCVQPSRAMAAGYYTYDGEKQRLVRNNANTENPNVRTIRTNQSTRVSNSGQGF
jgi:hypothetical protein